MKLLKNEFIETVKIIAADFDGKLCERKKFPLIGKPKLELIEWLKAQ